MLKKASFQNVTNFRDRDCDRDSRMAIAIVTAIEFSGRRSWLRLWLEILWLRLRLWLWLALFFMTVCTLKHRLWLWLKWWLWPSRNANFLWLRFRWLHDRLIISHNRDQFFFRALSLGKHLTKQTFQSQVLLWRNTWILPKRVDKVVSVAKVKPKDSEGWWIQGLKRVSKNAQR